MDPSLILFGIQSIVRLGKVGKDALEQHHRDEEVLFPGILDVLASPEVFVNGFFEEKNYRHYVIGDTAPYAEYWDSGRDTVKRDQNSIDTLFVLASKIEAENHVDSEKVFPGGQARAGVTLIQQWAPDKEPISPLVRVIMTAGDIALEYVGANPSVLGMGGNSEKLLGAFAKNLGEMLPDDGNYGPKERFGERILCTFLKAGFKVVGENPEWVAKEQHLQSLMSETIKPLMEALPQDSILKQLNYEKVADAVMGPAATAALTVLAKNQSLFLGSDFKTGTITGELTKALLDEAVKDGLKDQFTKDGLIELYKAALGIAVEQPELFTGSSDKPVDELCKYLISSCAERLKNAPFPYNGDTGARLAACVMDAISKNAHNFAGKDKIWEQTVADLVQEMAEDFGAAFETNKSLKTVFTSTQLVDMGRIVLSRVAATPSIISGPDEAVGEVIKAVAAAMAEDNNLLLSSEDWKEILAVAADEAAKNPGRLFKLDSGDAEPSLAADLMKGILIAASDIFRDPEDTSDVNLAKYAVLFGPTLRHAMITVIQNASGNIKEVKIYKEEIFTMIKILNIFIAGHHEEFGNKEWLRIFRSLLEKVLNGEDLPNLNLATASNLLA